ncbi:phenylalanine--tRNA ligase subunit alpha [Microgenomates group bacterium]|nr:phenylalanine--tRNA ligase subunit alpha [Microgenomates group bacterium]
MTIGEYQSLAAEVLAGKEKIAVLQSRLREVEDKREAGRVFNEVKKELEEREARKEKGAATPINDVTLPAAKRDKGHKHPISQAMEEIERIFAQIGFVRVRHPELDTDYFAFESLNMPPTHPARDEWETFFVDNPDAPEQKNLVLTPHTTNGDVREMLRLKSQPPVRMINIGRCYRRQQDATHTQMFHQFDGLVIDKDINITHLKGVLDHFAREFYGPDVRSRIRPFHFQFTEPSFEIDFSCHLCHGTGKIGETKCRFCKSGWHEVGGAGMIHPNVLRAGGIDPDVYSGLAFGWGIERTYTLKSGLNIDDIRQFYTNNLDFLGQF